MNTIKTLCLAALSCGLLLLSAKAASDDYKVGGPVPITEADLLAAQQGWIAALLQISEAHEKGEDTRALAKSIIAQAYNYDFAPVLFKPTLAHGELTFLTTAEGALAYFVGGDANFPDDKGFALMGWERVEVDNAAFFIEGNIGITMGHFTFFNKNGDTVTVEKTFVFRRGDDGALRIALHSSTIPFNPAS